LVVVDLEIVRTFVAVVDAGQFQAAADELSISQQAVSKRVAALEKDLGARLFTRAPRGPLLTVDGQAFLPHARELLRVEERATAAVRGDRRALRVDVISRRIAPAGLLQGFHRAHPEIELDVVTLAESAAVAIAAVEAGTLDATFRAVPSPLPARVEAVHAFDDRHELLVGPGHVLADAAEVTPAQLARHPLWMPGMARGTEWSAYYEELSAAFGLTIDLAGPVFGYETQLAEIAASPTLATFVGEGNRYLWPAEYDLRRIPVRNPTPVYPHSLLWRRDNPHPALTTLREYLVSTRREPSGTETWTPSWATFVTSR
jgi:DNA-binding transcriptional LysR family regulator